MIPEPLFALSYTSYILNSLLRLQKKLALDKDKYSFLSGQMGRGPLEICVYHSMNGVCFAVWFEISSSIIQTWGQISYFLIYGFSLA